MAENKGYRGEIVNNGIHIEGFKEIEDLLQDMTITEADEKKAMNKALTPILTEVKKNTPHRTGKLRDSVVKNIKKEGFATIGTIKMKRFYDIFQEFGTSQQKAHVGFFERSVNKTQNEAIAILSKTLLG